MSISSSKIASLKDRHSSFNIQKLDNIINQTGLKASSFRKILTDAMEPSNAGQTPSGDFASLDKEEIETLKQHVELKMNTYLLKMISDEPEKSSNTVEWVFDFFLNCSSLISADKEVSIIPQGKQISDTCYDSLINKASETYHVDAQLIRSVIKTESNFNPGSTSSKGAMGLMQLMPETAKDLGVRDAYNPKENIMAGVRYLKGLLDRYRGDVRLALAAYNWGMGNVDKYPKKMPLETKNYIEKVSANYFLERKQEEIG